MIRVIIPDSHGSYIDKSAKRAFLADLAYLKPREVVMLGDHVDCSGLFNAHDASSLDDMDYSYQQDCEAANEFLDEVMERCSPRCKYHYITGNHEWHVERWAARNVPAKKDAEDFIANFSPKQRLRLEERGIRVIEYHTRYDGLAVPNTIKLGNCLFTHGWNASKHSSYQHLLRAGFSIVHGHTHRAQSYVGRTMVNGTVAAYCPGTLAKLQPTYLHTALSDWTHGYSMQFVNRNTGSFLHVNVPIVDGKSMLQPMLSCLTGVNREG